MATWIVHLRLAENLLLLIPALDEQCFAIGNLAPDSGVPDENWENFEPPPWVTHFHSPEGSPWQIADLDFFRQYLLNTIANPPEPRDYSFLLGYFFHLITDNLWMAHIGRPTREKFPVDFATDSQFIWQVKRDWYGLDFDYVRSHPNCLYWRVLLTAQYEDRLLPFMPEGAIQRNLDHICQLYQRTDEEVEEWYIRRPDKYITPAQVDRFVEVGTQILLNAHRLLFINRVDPAGHTSVLEMNSFSDFTTHQPPGNPAA